MFASSLPEIDMSDGPSSEAIAAVLLVVVVMQVLLFVFGKELGLSFGSLSKAAAKSCGKHTAPMIASPSSTLHVYTIFLHPSHSRSLTSHRGISLVVTQTPDARALESDVKSGRITHIMMQGTILAVVTASRLKKDTAAAANNGDELIVISARNFESVLHVGKDAHINVPVPASSGVPAVIASAAPLRSGNVEKVKEKKALCVVVGWPWLT